MTVIDARGVPASKRFGFWSEVITRNYSPTENNAKDRQNDFTASMRGRYIGNLGVSQIKSAPICASRTVNSIRRNPLDCFFVSMLSKGTATLSQNGREVRQSSGDVVLYDSAAPFVYDMTTDYEGIWVRLPRKTVVSRFANAEALTARLTSSDTPIGRLVATIFKEALELELSAESPATSRIASSMVDILVAAIEAESHLDGSDDQRRINLLDHTKSYILANIDDPDIDTEALVNAVGVSRRTLNRLFTKEGTTPIRWLWRQRLLRGKELLESGREGRVTDVALNCGFSDFSHFSRAFKAEFGMSPKELLRDD